MNEHSIHVYGTRILVSEHYPTIIIEINGIFWQPCLQYHPNFLKYLWGDSYRILFDLNSEFLNIPLGNIHDSIWLFYNSNFYSPRYFMTLEQKEMLRDITSSWVFYLRVGQCSSHLICIRGAWYYAARFGRPGLSLHLCHPWGVDTQKGEGVYRISLSQGWLVTSVAFGPAWWSWQV